MSQLSKLYKKSGLRDIYEKNKSTILSAAALGTPQLLARAKDLKRNAEVKQAKVEEDQRKVKESRNNDLNNFLDDVAGGKPAQNRNVMGIEPVNPPMINPGVEDVVAPLPQVGPADVQQTGGVILRGDEASQDVAKLMAEAELQKKMQTDYAGGNKAERTKMLQEYADLITKQQQRVFGDSMPGLYEDLNTRGLLRSSELGNAVSREQAKAAAILQEQIGLQGLQDREAALNEGSGIQNQYYQGRYGAIQRGMSLEDFVRQTKAAQLTGLALQPQPQQASPSTKGGGMSNAIAGASVGSKFGPQGAAIGGVVGLLGSDPAVKGR